MLVLGWSTRGSCGSPACGVWLGGVGVGVVGEVAGGLEFDDDAVGVGEVDGTDAAVVDDVGDVALSGRQAVL